MLRLKLMPLVFDFGEVIHPTIEIICPKTQLVFTRDYRIFEQFSNCPDDTSLAARPGHIKVAASPSNLLIAVVHEDSDIGTEYIPVDGTAENMALVTAAQLKDLDMDSDTSPNNKAVKAFIDQLADETNIIMQWD